MEIGTDYTNGRALRIAEQDRNFANDTVSQIRNFSNGRTRQIAEQDENFANDTASQIKNITNERALQSAAQDRNFANDTNSQMRINQQYNQNGTTVFLNGELTGQISLLA